MKLIKIIGLFCLFGISFFYTEKVINVALNQDDIMIKIKRYSELHNTYPKNAIINGDTIIPGNIGKHIDSENSYKAMKKIGYFEPSLMVYKDVYPEISIYNNYNKYIIKGNTSEKKIALVYIFNNNTIDNILDISNKYSFKINIFTDANYLNNNISIIDKIKMNNIYSYGSNGNYTKDNLIIANNIINNKANNKAIFCLFLSEDADSLNNCANSKMLSILVNKNDNYSVIKNNLNNGYIFFINNTKELSNIVELILSKGYYIVPLDEIIKE